MDRNQKADRFGEFHLPNWIVGNSHDAKVSLAGSLGPSITLEELKTISSDPEATSAALKFDQLSLGVGTGVAGGQSLREKVAALYDQSKVKVTADDVVIANGTTGANALALQAMISPGDHVICVYPAYEPLFEVSKLLGADMSYWKLDPDNGWLADLEDLKSLIRPSTRMIIVNNPHNPTGTILSTSAQQEIIEIAAEHNIIVYADEIFRPLFHGVETPTSLVEHPNYDRTLVTGSLSKAWGLAGIRIGWIVTRNAELKKALLGLRIWSLYSVSCVDEVIGNEVLSERCNDRIVARNLAIAQTNIAALEAFAKDNPQSLSYIRPTGGGTTFVKFSHPGSGKPVDDVQFSRKLKDETGLLLSPGSLTFGTLAEGDFAGYVRLHTTASPEEFKVGLEKLKEFLKSQK